MNLRLSAGLAAGLLALAAAPAAAAPATVQLRIEGPTRTLFEGPVTTDVSPFHFTGDATQHQCDATPAAGVGGESPVPVPTRGAALTRAIDGGLAVTGRWFNGLGPSFETIDGESVAYDGTAHAYLVEYKNWKVASKGSCGDPIQNGDDVLYAWADESGTAPLLKLAGPARARPGEQVAVTVVDADGSPVVGATVGGAATDSAGRATLSFADRGDHVLKATKSGAVRSNATHVCVSDGSDGACGTSLPAAAGPPAAAPDRTPPRGALAGIRDHQVFARGRGPRVLRGVVGTDPSGLAAVKLRLTKRVGRHCWYFSRTREVFRGTHCGRGPYFAIGDRADWSYLLPARLGPGRYVLDAVAIDRAGNRQALARGSSRVVFTVR